MKYIDFELQIKQDAHDKYTVTSPLERGGEDEENFVLPFSDDYIKKVINRSIEDAISGRLSSSMPPSLLSDFGRQLFDTLFHGRIRDRFSAEYQAALDNDGRLRIKLNILPANLMGLPWEFLYSEQFGGFLALSHDTVVTRYSRGRNPRGIRDGLVPPLRILGMVSSPRDAPELNTTEEKLKIEHALKDLIQRGLIWIDWLEEATLDGLTHKLQTRDRYYHMFHFIGHGLFENEGYLLFEDQDGNAEMIDGETLGLILAGQPYLRLAMLNACESAHTSVSNPFASVATALIKQGIPAVIAMQYAIHDKDAANFSSQIYQALAQMQPIERAMTDGRVALARKRSGEWGIPVLYLGIPGNKIFPLSIEAETLEKKIRDLIQQDHWEEASHLCELLKSSFPLLYDRASGLQKLAQAFIHEKNLAWELVITCCDEGQRFIETDDQINHDHFARLRRKALNEHNITALLEKARRAFQTKRHIEAKEICDEIFKNKRNHPQTKALLQGIKAEEYLNSHKNELEEYCKRRDWIAMQKHAGQALKAVGIIDAKAAGVQFPMFRYFSEIAELAAAYLKAQDYLEHDEWEFAEAKLQLLCTQDSDLCPDAMLLYVQSRQLLAAGKKSEAITKLQQLQTVEPFYRDSALLLQSVIDDDQERDRLYTKVEEQLRSRQWSEALDLCKRITAFTFPKADDTIIVLESALERFRVLSPKFQSSLLADPALQWPGGMPYDIFTRLGISTQSSIEAINNASFDLQLQQNGISTEEQAAWDCLRSVPQRLSLDALLYPVHDPHKLLLFLETFLIENRCLPSREHLKAALPEDAALVLLFMGQRAEAAQHWEEMQRDNPSDSTIAHKLGTLYYWQARTEQQTELWHKAMGNWAIVLEDDAFWQKWGEKRAESYGISITVYLSKLQQKIENKFAEDLLPDLDLSLMLHTEFAAAHLLKEAGGLPLPGSMFDKIACGPIMIEALGLETQLARFIARYNAAAQDISKQIEYIDNSTDLLQRYFSQLRIAAVLLDRDQPEQTLVTLQKRDQSHCPTTIQCTMREQKQDLPFVFCTSCPQFEQANPAYKNLPARGQALFDDAIEIAIAAHLRIAEQTLTIPNPTLSVIAEHWRQVVRLATFTSKGTTRQEEVQFSIREIALGRIRFLLQQANEKEKNDFVWYEEIDSLHKISSEITGTNADITSIYADALSLRGVQRFNMLEEIVGYESDLRKAFELKPSSIHIREQLVLAKKRLALYVERRGDAPRSKQILEEARLLAIHGLEAYPERANLQEDLEDIEILLSSWEPIDEASSQSLFQREVELIEQQLRQNPGDSFLQAELLDTLIQYSEDLIAQGAHSRGLIELERRLHFFPDDTQLRNLINFTREGYKIENFLKSAALRFREVVLDTSTNRTFRLPFEAPFPLQINVVIDVVGDVAIISVAFPLHLDTQNSQLLDALLQLFYTMPFYKPCWNTITQELTIKAGTPVEFLNTKVLEAIVQTSASYVRVNTSITTSTQKLCEHLQATIIEDLLEPCANSPLPTNLLPEVCQKASISHQVRSDGIFVLQRTPTSPEILASRTDIAICLSFATGISIDQNLASYLHLLTTNENMKICKIVLDTQRKIVLQYELPSLNEKWLISAVEALEVCASRFV